MVRFPFVDKTLHRMERLFRGDHLLIVRSILGGEISRPNLGIRFAEGLISGQPSDHMIDIHIAALEVLHPCIARQVVHKRHEAFLALPQRLLRLLALNDFSSQCLVCSLNLLNRSIKDISRAPLFVWRTAWDKTTDAQEFFRAYNTLLGQRATAQGAGSDSDRTWLDGALVTRVRVEGDTVTVVRGAEAEVSATSKLTFGR